MLKFDINRFNSEFLIILENEIDNAARAWEQEVLSKLGGTFSKISKVSHDTKIQSKHLIAYLEANTGVLADSYGTGSLMLDDNPGLKEYMGNSRTWNPLRSGKTIVGRGKGKYINLFNQQRSSSGKFAGKPIEGKQFGKGKYTIRAVAPSYAIQTANEILFKQWLPIAIKNTVRRIDFSKFLV